MSLSRYQGDGNFGMVLAEKPTQFQSAHARHHDIGQDKVDVMSLISIAISMPSLSNSPDR